MKKVSVYLSRDVSVHMNINDAAIKLTRGANLVDQAVADHWMVKAHTLDGAPDEAVDELQAKIDELMAERDELMAERDELRATLDAYEATAKIDKKAPVATNQPTPLAK
jgi:type I restriction-modification system DNA methylase subunit